ncbi:MAG: hypothetical protein HY711_08145 [Candidatus Melainabacteria bacterium]|nr:hypothetical protein [Candidatus Melainabacteria bacterium]
MDTPIESILEKYDALQRSKDEAAGYQGNGSSIRQRVLESFGGLDQATQHIQQQIKQNEGQVPGNAQLIKDADEHMAKQDCKQAKVALMEALVELAMFSPSDIKNRLIAGALGRLLARARTEEKVSEIQDLRAALTKIEQELPWESQDDEEHDLVADALKGNRNAMQAIDKELSRIRRECPLDALVDQAETASDSRDYVRAESLLRQVVTSISGTYLGDAQMRVLRCAAGDLYRLLKKTGRAAEGQLYEDLQDRLHVELGYDFVDDFR